MKRLLNTIKDTHVMATRHPLTIPAALVLGTAIAATALPLPSSTTATASGTAYVTRTYTDKSTHTPGTQATITAEASGDGTVHFSVSHLGVEVTSGDATVENGKATWAYTTPSENNQGYLVTVTGADGTHAETALDVSSSWTRFPRMGFLSHFKPTAPEGTDGHTTYEAFLFQKPQDYIDKLSQDYHINALQYYDWQYRHEQPVATGDLENQWPLWYANTYASKKTISDYVTDAKNANIGSLAYSMAYAANDGYDTNAIKDEWILRNDDGSYWRRGLGNQWWVNTPEGTPKPENHMTMMNVNAQGWRDYITDQYVAQKDAFGFDGTHIDTLGQTVKKDAAGNSVDLTDGLTALVNDTAAKTGTATGINLPDGAGTDKIGPSSASYVYTELWDHNETNQQVATYLQGARNAAGNKAQIVAAYANNYDPTQSGRAAVPTQDGPRIEAESDQASVSGGVHTISFWVPTDRTYTPVNIDCITFREFNTDSVKLADAAFAANGAHHLELGDYGRMLDNEFFVNSGRSMSTDLQTWMKNYYNISTAYENLLYGDNLTRRERQVDVTTNGVGLPTSTDGAANTIWANTMTSDAGTALHLINLRTDDQDGNDQYWRNAAKRILPFDNTSVTYHLEEGEAVPASVFAVSPDDDGGRPTPLDFMTGTDEQGRTTITFNVGRLSSWDMVVFSPTANAAGSHAATTTSEAVTGQVRNDLGQCLTSKDPQGEDGTPVLNANCAGDSDAQTVTYEDGHLRIGDRCVDVVGGFTEEGTQAVISQCSSSSPSQRWSLPSPAGK